MAGDDEKCILDLERRRCAAIDDGDIDALRACLSEDYLHVGGAGAVVNREDYIAAIVHAPRAPERSGLNVRVYGDAAVLTGHLINRIGAPGEAKKTVEAFATQVAIRTDGIWRFVAFQLTQKRAP